MTKNIEIVLLNNISRITSIISKLLMEQFPVYEGENMSEYLEKLEKFGSSTNKPKYNLILKFVQRWIRDQTIKIRSLEDFNNISQFGFPSEEKSKEIMNKYAEDLCEKLDIEYEFDEAKVIKHYDELKKTKTKSKKNSRLRNKETDSSNSLPNCKIKHSVDNAAHDYRHPFRSEVILFVRLMLVTIDYKFNSRRAGKNILWDIKKNKTIDINNRYKSISSSIKEKSKNDESDGDKSNNDEINDESENDSDTKPVKKDKKKLSTREMELYDYFSKLK